MKKATTIPESKHLKLFATAIYAMVILLSCEISFAQPQEPYLGPLMIAKFDYDLTLDDGREISVFLWNESTSPFLDLTQMNLPREVRIPIRDWEHGVSSKTAAYHQVPLKFLFGVYADGAMRIRNPGNSYYDEPIKLSNGKSINPRFYFIHPEKSYARAFRTNRVEGFTAIEDASSRMVSTKKTGRAFRLFKLLTSPNLPVFTGISTISGNEQSEWAAWTQNLIDGKMLLEGATVNFIRAYSNPALSLNDWTAGSTQGRQEGDLKQKKLEEMAYDIDHVLSRRMDRTSPGNPKPNVYLFVDDDIETIKKARALFEAKVKAVKDFDASLKVARPPLRLILWNLAPRHQYEDLPNAYRTSQQALANNPVNVSEIMVFESNFRYSPGSVPVKKLNPTDPKKADALVVATLFGVSEDVAEKALSGKADCNILLGGKL